jgi:hypothetical protein
MLFFAKKYVNSIVSLALIIILCLPAQSVLSFDTFRPSAELRSVTNAMHLAEELQGKSGSAGEIIALGPCSPPHITIFATGALISTYSAYDILRHIKQEDIDKEIKALRGLIERLTQAVTQATGNGHAAALLREENGYEHKVRNYLLQRRHAELQKGQLVRNSIGALEFFLAVDLRKARAARETEKIKHLICLLEAAQKLAFEDIDQPPEAPITEEDAYLLWGQFCKAQDAVFDKYDKQIKELTQAAEDMTLKINALVLRNGHLVDNELQQAQDKGDAEEESAIWDTIHNNEALIKQCQDARENLKTHADIVQALCVQIREVGKEYVKGADNIISKQRTPLQILYTTGYAFFERSTLKLDPFESEYIHKTYTVNTDIMRMVESIMVAMKPEITPFYIKVRDNTPELILFSNHEMSMDTLEDILKTGVRIKAICLFEGTPNSHIVVMAQRNDIPIIFLNSSKHDAEDFAFSDKQIIIETTKEGGTVISNPDPETEKRYKQSGTEQGLRKKFALEKHLLRARGQAGLPHASGQVPYKCLGVCASVASAQAVGKASGMKIGIGLYRTELDISETTKTALKHYIAGSEEQYQQQLLDAFINDMYNILKESKEHKGPFILRTDDIEFDKDIAGIANLLKTVGFDLYRNPIGQKIITLRIAGYYIALDNIRRDELAETLKETMEKIEGAYRELYKDALYIKTRDALLGELAFGVNSVFAAYDKIEKLAEQRERNIDNALAGNISSVKIVEALVTKIKNDLEPVFEGKYDIEKTVTAKARELAQSFKIMLAAKTDRADLTENAIDEFTDSVKAALEKTGDAQSSIGMLIAQLSDSLRGALVESAVNDLMQKFAETAEKQLGLTKSRKHCSALSFRILGMP